MYNSVQLYPGVNSGFTQIWDLLKSIVNPFPTMEKPISRYDKKNKYSKLSKYSKITNDYKKIAANTPNNFNSITAIHSKEGTKWYKGEFDEFDAPVSALCNKDSIIYPDCKSLVYFDENITCAYIDYTNSGSEKIKNIELRQDGEILGIKKENGKWQPYFINNGAKNSNYTKSELNDLYIKIKNILKKAQSNSELIKNTPIKEINNETDKIYSDILCKMI